MVICLWYQHRHRKRFANIIVTGSVDPSILASTTEKFGIIAKLLVHEKDPIHAKEKLDQFLNNIQIGQARNVSPSKDKKDDNHDKLEDHQPTSALQDSDFDDDYLNYNHY